VTLPPIVIELQALEQFGALWMARVVITLADDACPIDTYMPRAEISVPIDPHGKPFEQVRQEAIRLAQGCIREEALLALVRLP